MNEFLAENGAHFSESKAKIDLHSFQYNPLLIGFIACLTEKFTISNLFAICMRILQIPMLMCVQSGHHHWLHECGAIYSVKGLFDYRIVLLTTK